jgi:prepilin peptidase CpaA
MSLEFFVALAVGLVASGEDLWRRNISNWIPLGALLGGLLVQVMSHSWKGLAYWAGGAAAGFGVFLIFYMLGGMGGGDVKLMAGFGSILGPYRLLDAAFWTAGIGGVMAAAVVCFYEVRKLYRRRQLAAEARKRAASGEAAAAEQVLAPDDAYIPYAPAITLGAWVAMIPKGV